MIAIKKVQTSKNLMDNKGCRKCRKAYKNKILA